MRTSQLALCIGLSLVGSGAYSDTTFTGTGSWHDPNRWNNGVPDAATKAVVWGTASVLQDATGNPIVLRNGASVSVDNAKFSSPAEIYFGSQENDKVSFSGANATVQANTFHFGPAAGGAVDYVQNGGAFTSDYLTEFYGYCATTAIFANVDAVFTGWRFVFARGNAPLLAKFRGGTFLSDRDFFMGLWNGSTGTLAFDNTDVKLGGDIKIGYGNESATEPVTLRFENGSVVRQKNVIKVGVPQRSGSDPFHRSYGRIVGVDSTWTNEVTQRIYIGGQNSDSGDGLSSCGEMILSNCTFWTANSGNAALCLAHSQNVTGKVEVVGGKFTCPVVYAGCQSGAHARLDLNGTDYDITNLNIGFAQNAYATLALHNQQWTKLETPYSRLAGSHSTLELVDSTIDNTAEAMTIGKLLDANDSGSVSLRMVGGRFTSSKNVLIGDSSQAADGLRQQPAVFECVNCAVTCSAMVVVGRWKNSPGTLVLRNSAVSANSIDVCYDTSMTCSLTNIGSKVALNYLRLPAENAAGSTAYYRDGEGSETTVNNDFRGCHVQGTLIAEIGGKMSVPGRFFTCMKDNSTSRITVTPTGLIDVGQNDVNLGWSGYSSVSTLELQGVVLAKRIMPFNADASKPSGELYFNGGTFKASADATEILHGALSKCAVGAGGAKFDSNGHAVTSAHALVHDDRSGAAVKDGGIVKMGEGTVTLKGALTFNGPVRVEKGTLDLSATTYAATPGISGSGALKVSASGLTVTGENKFGNGDTGVAVDGAVTFGPDATVTCDDPDALEIGKPYTLLTATSVTGTPKMDLPKKRGVIYDVVNTGTAIVCTAHKSGLFLVVQ